MSLPTTFISQMDLPAQIDCRPELRVVDWHAASRQNERTMRIGFMSMPENKHVIVILHRLNLQPFV